MMKCVLKNPDGVMLKSLDNANTTLELTTDVNEAYNYTNGDWFANSELDFIKFHYGKNYPQVMTMKSTYVDTEKDNTEMNYWTTAGPAEGVLVV